MSEETVQISEISAGEKLQPATTDLIEIEASDGTSYFAQLGNLADAVGDFSDFASTGIDDNATSTAVTINGDNRVVFSKSGFDFNVAGVQINEAGLLDATYDNGRCVRLNRLTSDGEVIELYRDVTQVGSLDAATTGVALTAKGARNIFFDTDGSERARINTNGHFIVGKTSTSFNVAGAYVNSDGAGVFTRDGSEVVFVNRLTSDGTLVAFYQNSILEGDISVSGTTVSYNGAHLSRWAQWADGYAPSLVSVSDRDDEERPVCLRGTVLSNVDEECVWYAVEFERQVVLKVATEAAPAEYKTVTEHILYDGPGDMGDVIDYEHEGKTYRATIVKEDNEQLNRVKVSDVAADRNWAGVFQDYDFDDVYAPYDFYVARKGDFLVRIAQGITVELGDLLESAGDGTARPQIDQTVIRPSTLAKVTMTGQRHIYDDGTWLCAVELF